MPSILKGGGLPPPGFPRMLGQPERVDSLAWYDIHEHGAALTDMTFEARSEIVPLLTPHPSVEHWLGVPRTLAPEPAPDRDYRATGAFEFEAEFTGDLRPEQVPFVSGVFNTLENELGCIGEAPTGFGKTTTACWLAAQIGRPICVVIPKGDLDWKPELLKHTTIPENKIDYWQGGHLPDPEAWVVIAMLQSVYRQGYYPASIYNRFACLIVDECFHPSHDLYVRGRGWTPVSEVCKGDAVLSFNAETGEALFQEAQRIVTKHFSGDMVSLEGPTYKGLTTPGHEQPIKRKRKNGDYSLDRVKLGSLAPQSKVKVPVSGMLSGEDGLSPMDKLRIAHEADGCLLCPNSGYHRFMFRRVRKIERVRLLLGAANIEYKESVNAQGDTSFTFNSMPCFTKTLQWFDPFLSGRKTLEFLEELTKWDGWVTPASNFWETDSKPCAELVRLAAHVTGHQASITHPKPGRFRVRWSASTGWVNSSSIRKKKVPYSGLVHCVTVQSGNVFTRYNGTVSVSGNCHRIGSQEFGKVMLQFPAMFRLGLSATPERRDGKMDLIHSHMGWRHVVGHSDAEKPLYYLIPSSWTEPKSNSGKVVRYDPSRTNHAKRSMMQDSVRNARIAGAAWRAHKAGRRIIVFVEQVKHGQKIKSALRSMGVPESRVIEYNGSITKDLKEKAKACPEGMILIATYKYTAEGTNIPALDTCILAHPLLDPRQAVGRILRKLPGKQPPIVLDVWDEDCGTLRSIATKRWEYLRKIGAIWKGPFQ